MRGKTCFLNGNYVAYQQSEKVRYQLVISILDYQQSTPISLEIHMHNAPWLAEFSTPNQYAILCPIMSSAVLIQENIGDKQAKTPLYVD